MNVISMKSTLMPSKDQKLIAAYIEKGIGPAAAARLAKRREIELERRKIIDDRPCSKNGRQIAEAKFRKYFNRQIKGREEEIAQQPEMAGAYIGKHGLFIQETKRMDGSSKDVMLVEERGPSVFGFHALGDNTPQYVTKHYMGMAVVDAVLRIGNCDSCELEDFKFRYISMMADSWQGANEAKKRGDFGFRLWLIEKMESPEAQALLDEYSSAFGQSAMKRLSSFMMYDFCALAGVDTRLALTDMAEVTVISKSFFMDPALMAICENVSEFEPKISLATRDIAAIRSIAFMLEGTDRLQAKDYHAAFECFDYAIGLWNMNHYAHSKRAVCACNMGYEIDGLADINIAIAIHKDPENPWRDDSLHAGYRLDRATVFMNLAYRTGKMEYARQALKDCRKSLSLQDSKAGHAMLMELEEVFGLGRKGNP